MNLKELIETAHLDVLGLLDDEERARFEAALSSASPAMQAEVRREQARVARAEAFFPEADAAPDLRARVIDAVDRASRVESAVALAAGRGSPELASPRRVSRVWRAAALGLATAASVLGVLLVQLTAQYRDLHRRVSSDTLVAQMVAAYGSEYVYDALFDERTQRVVFSPSDSFEGQASILTNPDWDSARLFCHALPTEVTDGRSGRTYHLAVIDEAGAVVEVLASFDSQGSLIAEDVSLAAGPTQRLGIVPTLGDGSLGAPVLATTKP